MAKAQCARLTKFIIPSVTDRPDRQQEQQHPVREPVEQDAEDGSERHGLPPLQPIASEPVAYFLPADPGSLTFSTLSNTTLRSWLPTLRTCRM